MISWQTRIVPENISVWFFLTIYNAFEQGFDEEQKFLWRNICEKSIANFKSYSQVSGHKSINIS
jgi:hypothetical protein